jgi:hypothetical protein
MALSRESENSEDGSLRLQVNQAADRLKAVIAPFVESSKTMAINMADQVYNIFRISSRNEVVDDNYLLE